MVEESACRRERDEGAKLLPPSVARLGLRDSSRIPARSGIEDVLRLPIVVPFEVTEPGGEAKEEREMRFGWGREDSRERGEKDAVETWESRRRCSASVNVGGQLRELGDGRLGAAGLCGTSEGLGQLDALPPPYPAKTYRTPLPIRIREIGRASCRERAS